MSENKVGDFFVSLGVKADKNAFEEGFKQFDQMSNKVNRLIGTIRNAAVVAAAFKIADASSQEIKVSEAMGVSTEKLDAWKAAASIAGVNANGLVSSMGRLASVMNHLDINGQGLDQYASKLAELGVIGEDLNIFDLEEMDPADAYKRILEAAQNAIKNGQDKVKVTTIVGDILGAEGQGLFTELERRKQSIGDFLAGAEAKLYMTEEDREDAAEFAAATRELGTSLKGIGEKFTNSLATQVTPYVKIASEFIDAHKEDIIKGIDTIATGVGNVFKKAEDIVSWLTQDPEKDKNEYLNSLKEANTNVISLAMEKGQSAFERESVFSPLYNGSTEAEKKVLEEQYEIVTRIQNAAKGGKNKKIIEEKDVTPQLVEDIRLYQKYGGNYDLIPMERKANDLITGKYGIKPQRRIEDEPEDSDWYKPFEGMKPAEIKMNDGIVRPGGQVTQVAPDDWVFAARNIGDLARAFIPQQTNNTEHNNTFSIVQNFTINGTRELPQTIKQQAYTGVRDGLMVSLNQSSIRLQQMSGTR